jgi:methylglyoxal reductase
MDSNPLNLSPLGYGGWEAGGGTTWGSNTDEGVVIDAIHRAIDLGANWVDTAQVYGGGGGSEAVLGKALAGRSDVMVCTKVAPEPDDSQFTAAGLRANLEQSFKRLRREQVDLYLLHWPANRLPLESTWAALAALRDEGLVRRIGLSNYHASDLRRCAEIAPVDYVQIQASMLYLDELRAHVTDGRRLDVGVLAYGPLAYGLLTGTIDESTVFEDWRNGTVMSDDFFCAENYARFFAPAALASHLPKVRQLERIARDTGCTVAQLALSWLIGQDRITGAAVGSRNPRHVDQNFTSTRLHLSDSTRDLISTILFPGRDAVEKA